MPINSGVKETTIVNVRKAFSREFVSQTICCVERSKLNGFYQKDTKGIGMLCQSKHGMSGPGSEAPRSWQ